MQAIFAIEEALPNHWIYWCRLCAKEDTKQNINFFYTNEDHLNNGNKKSNIPEALAKYFCVQTSLEDSLPKMLCTNCLSLISCMINFNERVERVQLMFRHLAEAVTATNLNEVRLEFDVTELERDRWFKNCTLIDFDKNWNELTMKENSKPFVNDGKLKVQIKQENAEKHISTDSADCTNQSIDLDKEEMVLDENVNISCLEDDHDPFHQNENQEMSSSEGAEYENARHSILRRTEVDVTKSELDRCKKKRKRKKIKQFVTIDCKKKKTVNDLKMVASCKDCEKTFSKYMLYREHMQQQHNHSRSEKHWPCPACDKILISIYNLKRHVRIHVPLDVKQILKCSECDNRYTSNAQLQTHIRYKHKNEKPFICEECGLRLRTNSNLRQHMLTHTDIAPFECDVCKKKFKNKTRLKTHMDIHSPNKHVCNICGLQLNSRATLNRHFLVHSDEMHHKCDYCGKAFKRGKALKNHLLLHTGLKPYSCDFCERIFANGSNCRSHMKKTHPEELAILEASGNKTHTKNIPKLSTLKAVTKAADNLTPVVTKFSGCFAFGKKPKHIDFSDSKITDKTQKTVKYSPALQNDNDKLSATMTASIPLDLQYMSSEGNNATCEYQPNTNNMQNGESMSTPIPNFDNIYQHLLKRNQTGTQIKQPTSEVSPQSVVGGATTTQNNPFYNNIDQSIKTSLQPSDDLLHSPESRHSSMSTLPNDDLSNPSSIQERFYGTIRTTLPPDSFM